MRTSFQSFLTDVQKRHRAYVDALDANDPLRRSLALMFPSFVSEVKLDGERILAHVKRGVVKLQVGRCAKFVDVINTVVVNDDDGDDDDVVDGGCGGGLGCFRILDWRWWVVKCYCIHVCI